MSSPKKSSQPFWLGGAAAAMAACFTHPLDQTKYRMQVQSSKQNMLRAMYMFASRDGIRSLWSGLSASLLRQATYSTTRFGVYNYLAQEARQLSGKPLLSGQWTIACAGLAGGIAGMVGNPTEVVLVRMCADGAKVSSMRFGYSNALQGMFRIGREEGLAAFSRGLGPNIVRSILMNVSQIATYAAAKQRIISATSMQDGIHAHFLASFLAGTIATTVCAPADVLKSRMQSGVKSRNERGGLIHVIQDSLKQEGPRSLMKGWTPAWLRLTPNTILTFIFMEKLQKLIDSTPWRRKEELSFADASEDSLSPRSI